MREYSIGEVAREAGLAASALRYYEKEGLLPAPARRSKQRRYDESVFARLLVIRSALDAGFTIGETRQFLSGDSQVPPSARWRALASRKLVEVDELMARAQRMKSLLETSFHCGCRRLEDCERYIREARREEKIAPRTQPQAANPIAAVRPRIGIKRTSRARARGPRT